MVMKKKIIILLSSWNGEKYIYDLLNSILNQIFSGDALILIRDDGSTDSTIKIIENLNDHRIKLFKGKNIGVKKSFFELVELSKSFKPDFIVFADQDDIWIQGKIQRAIDLLSNLNGPALYCSALTLVDQDLNHLSYYDYKYKLSLESSLLSNCCTGCTCVINKDLLNIIKPPKDYSLIFMHDWWMYATAILYGTVVYDKESFIMYRQHSSNQVGMLTGFRGLKSKFLGLKNRSRKASRFSQACALLDCYLDCNYKSKLLIEFFIKNSQSKSRRALYIVRLLSSGSRLSLTSLLGYIFFG
jgi:glycosyltransferase involved in cell wall biosynthesis